MNHAGPGPDSAVAERGVGTELTALPHPRLSEQADAGTDGGVGADGHVGLHPRASRGEEGDSGPSVVFEDAALGQLLGGHEIGAVVDPEGDRRVVRHVSDYAPAV